MDPFFMGSRKDKIHRNAPDFDSSAASHPPVHISMFAIGGEAADGLKDKQGGGILTCRDPKTSILRLVALNMLIHQV
jgi:hypothetical protein